jgi:hypothetical protein
MARCEFLQQCGFYHKYGHKQGPAWQGLFAAYCGGDLVSICERWKSYRQAGAGLHDDIMPCGEPVPRPFTQIL